MPDKSTDKPADKPLDLGIYSEDHSGGMAVAEVIALLLSLLWIASVVFYFNPALKENGQAALDPLVTVMKFLAFSLPIGMIWVAAFTARALRATRTESARLQAAIDAMRQTYIAQAQSGGMGVIPSVEKKLDEIAAAQKQTESAITTFTRAREQNNARAAAQKPAVAMAEVKEDSSQTSLALDIKSHDPAPSVSVADFICALNFPESVDDKEGFHALRRALRDPKAARLIQASQDVLTLLSQDGIYMDDLKPDTAASEVWRRFARGERGQSVAALGGVRDRSSLALASGRMRKDPIFRDAVHHFLRQFDKTFTAFELNAGDQEIADLSATRTARAVMLLGRVTGTFD